MKFFSTEEKFISRDMWQRIYKLQSRQAHRKLEQGVIVCDRQHEDEIANVN